MLVNGVMLIDSIYVQALSDKDMLVIVRKNSVVNTSKC